MPKRSTRRTFIRHAAVAGPSLPALAPPLVRGASPNWKLNLAGLGEGKTSSPFSYAGRLTEMVLLGNIAMRLPRAKLQWDSANLRFTDTPEANRFITKAYRKGWDVPRLT